MEVLFLSDFQLELPVFCMMLVYKCMIWTISYGLLKFNENKVKQRFIGESYFMNQYKQS